MSTLASAGVDFLWQCAFPCSKKDQQQETNCSLCWSVAPIWRDTVELRKRESWGRVCGRAKLLAGTLRCLRLCWRLPWDWSNEEQLGRCPQPHKGRCPLTLQGGSPLDPSARLSWRLLHALSACLSTCLFAFVLFPLQVKHKFLLISPENDQPNHQHSESACPARQQALRRRRDSRNHDLP